MKAVLMSIQPKWCELIAKGKKTIEVRKTKPKLETPFKVYIYCTKGETIYLPRDIFGNNALNGKVIGEFMCNKIDYWQHNWNKDVMHIGDISKLSCVSVDDLLEYLNGTTSTNGCEKKLYAWHISDLKFYDKPKELDYFRKPLLCPRGIQNDNCKGCWDCEIKRPPQSWCYVERHGDNYVP